MRHDFGKFLLARNCSQCGCTYEEILDDLAPPYECFGSAGQNLLRAHHAEDAARYMEAWKKQLREGR